MLPPRSPAKPAPPWGCLPRGSLTLPAHFQGGLELLGDRSSRHRLYAHRRGPLSSPGQVLGESVHLVVVLAGGEVPQLVQEIGQPWGLHGQEDPAASIMGLNRHQARRLVVFRLASHDGKAGFALEILDQSRACACVFDQYEIRLPFHCLGHDPPLESGKLEPEPA